ncbi:restriction endonuclease [Cytobacillus firmus]|uniref:Restriction endonuclease type IV Mrr domain-containing protein n=1 Tax=Cytobacillus firmus TaxID=1399 RepID=A0A380XBT3_CYTFI|nr:restriction endonuclease [Cytobacillus firmus]KAF0823001.1 putative protein YphG [Cytobacillus firmus]MEC1895138.1 restriction endonuclease [Cytobacillus firmus]MED4449206.1 restriction endonuclease [Cytobacillus firmus]MED4767411.1 restriction endonuclease [Cytobacillus firmus]SUV00765.1 endonuclease [Cytobacillus firmus]
MEKLQCKALEDFTIPLLTQLGYTITRPNDENSDISFLLISPTGSQAIVKVKSHKREIGIRLVQITLKQMDTYDASKCWVITNERFKQIRLYDREQFIDWILKAQKEEKIRG